MYEYTDVIIRYLNKRFIGMFHSINSVVSFDELNVLQSTRSLYEEVVKLTEEMFVKLARYYYKKNTDSPKIIIDGAWVLAILTDYDPITKYVFCNEVDRKQGRLAESLIASANKTKEVDTALRYWSAMVSQYAIEITDDAVRQAYLDDDVEKVMWVTTLDERRCAECASREGKIYPIEKVPPKPHIGCRCYLVPWFGEED